MQPGMVKNGGNKNGLIVAIIAIAIIVIEFLSLMTKTAIPRKTR